MSTTLRLIGKPDNALKLESALHRGAFFGPVDRAIEFRLKRALRGDRLLLDRHVKQLRPLPSTHALFDNPARLLGHRILAVKSPTQAEKGVLILDYSFVFPLFALFFDVEQVASRYHIVLEPSWAGYCELDLLCYLRYRFPVFVQNYEPRDIAFIASLGSQFISVPIAANWWVDHRVFRPLAHIRPDSDILLIASWARFKRHEAFFASLARRRRRGERLRTILVGYPTDLTRDEVFRMAKERGVSDQVEMFERLSPEEVNYQLNRVKVNLLWSRREGFNRALIEGFYSDTPGIMRHGFNYGYQYPYINAQTGSFATESTLAETLLDMTRNHGRYSPRMWALENMSPQIATQMLDRHIGEYASANGKNWTPGQIAIKVTSLDTMSYWNEGERQRFENDYEFLRSMLRPAARLRIPFT